MASISSLLYLKLLIRGVSGIPMNVSLWMSASWIGNCSIFGRVTTCSWLHEKPTILQAKPLSASRSWETAIASAGKSHENPRLQWLWRKQTLLDLHELGCFSSTTRPDMHDTWKNGRKWRKKKYIYIYYIYKFQILMNIQYLGQISTNLQVLFSSPKEWESTQEETKPCASPMDPWLLIQKLSRLTGSWFGLGLNAQAGAFALGDPPWDHI